ncbi:MAG: serine O-acetyltransferase EpsC [Phycisphaerales bacterium]|nr:serine O-acetyltransferase EpsC [Phycisphaerales bacterium]
MKDRNEPAQNLTQLVEALVRSIHAEPRLQHLNRVHLPSRERIIRAIELLRQLMYPGYFSGQTLTSENLACHVGGLMLELDEILFEQVRCCLRYRENVPADERGEKCDECDAEARRIVNGFFARLPHVREILAADVQAAFDGDPAAQSTDETIFCYPGLLAITVQRLAHEFYKLNVPLLPRIMTEWAHGRTGIDIHPGATLGKGLMIDHGTGVVIGETTIIGNNVKIYQGVTLGALAPAFGQLLRGQKRHPTIEDDVTIYAGATILGGETVIGRGSTIGGNLFLTSSVPPMHVVTAEPPKINMRDRRPKRERGGEYTI